LINIEEMNIVRRLAVGKGAGKYPPPFSVRRWGAKLLISAPRVPENAAFETKPEIALK
jgi:hypothetical protein